MHYHAHERPRQSNGIPMLVDEHGQGLVAIPAISVKPVDSGLWLFTVFVPLATNQSAPRYYETGNPVALLDEYAADPELALATYFGWKYSAPAVTKPVSLSDLGL